MKTYQDPKEPREWSCTDDSPFNDGWKEDERRPLYSGKDAPYRREDGAEEDDVWGNDYDENTERFD